MTAADRFYDEFHAALKASNDRRNRAKVAKPCPICGTTEPHGLHFMRRDGVIEPFDYNDRAPRLDTDRAAK